MNKKTEDTIIELCVERLSDMFGQKAILQRKEYLGGGCINHALLLKCNTGDFFLKWNSSCDSDMFVKEAAGLREMFSAHNEFLIIPNVIWAKEVDELPGLLLMEYLQPTANTFGFDEKLGRGLAILHQHFAEGFGFHHDNYCGATVQNNQWNTSWIDFFGQQRILHLVHLIAETRGLTTSEIQIFEKLVAKLPSILSDDAKPSLIHGDLWSGNFMYTTKGPALIDPATYYADREMELSIMTMFGGFSPRVWDAYQEMNPLSSGWKERNRLYQLYHVLNHYFLFGGSYLSQANYTVRQFI